MIINDMKSLHQLIEEINVETENNRDDLLIEFNKNQNNGLNNLWYKVEVFIGERRGK